MDKDIKESLYVRLIRFARKYPEGFKYKEIIESEELKLKDWEKQIVDRHFSVACKIYQFGNNTVGETIFTFVIGNSADFKSKENSYIVAYEAEFTYVDYEEIKFARENAKEAKKFSIVAIWLSIGAIFASVLTPILIALYMNQTITIEKIQFESLAICRIS